MMLVDVKMCNAGLNSVWSATCTMTFRVEGSCAVFSPPSSLSPAKSSGMDGNQDDRSRIKLQCPAEILLEGYRLMHKHRADFFFNQVYSCSLGPTMGLPQGIGFGRWLR